jgi:thiol-disulfide isomerase/thioredoxin
MVCYNLKMKQKTLFLPIIPLLISCAQPLTPEQYVKQFSASFDENASVRFDSLFESMMKSESTYGDKFLLIYFKDACSFCRDLYPALQELSENSGNYFDTNIHSPFKFYSFFIDDYLYEYSGFMNEKYNIDESYFDLIEHIGRNKIPQVYLTDTGIPTPFIIFFDNNKLNGEILSFQAFWIGVPGSTNEEKILKIARLWDYTNLSNS